MKDIQIYKKFAALPIEARLMPCDLLNHGTMTPQTIVEDLQTIEQELIPVFQRRAKLIKIFKEFLENYAKRNQ